MCGTVAGGIGSIGGLLMSPKALSKEIARLKQGARASDQHFWTILGSDQGVLTIKSRCWALGSHGLKLPAADARPLRALAALRGGPRHPPAGRHGTEDEPRLHARPPGGADRHHRGQCAVGVPPCWVMEKLHAAQVLVANMVGSVRNAEKALEAKVEPRMRDLGGSEPQIAVFSWWIYCF